MAEGGGSSSSRQSQSVAVGSVLGLKPHFSSVCLATACMQLPAPFFAQGQIHAHRQAGAGAGTISSDFKGSSRITVTFIDSVPRQDRSAL